MSREAKKTIELEISLMVTNSILKSVLMILHHKQIVSDKQLTTIPDVMEKHLISLINKSGEPNEPLYESLNNLFREEFTKWREYMDDLVTQNKKVNRILDGLSFPDIIFDKDDDDEPLN